MTNYKGSIIEFSLDDVIHILEHAPVQSDMVPEIVVARIMNRGPIAHLAIERALKFLLEKANGTWEEHHNFTHSSRGTTQERRRLRGVPRKGLRRCYSALPGQHQ